MDASIWTPRTSSTLLLIGITSLNDAEQALNVQARAVDIPRQGHDNQPVFVLGTPESIFWPNKTNSQDEQHLPSNQHTRHKCYISSGIL